MSRGIFIILFLLLALPAVAAGLVNINTADQAALETLKGIGPTKAKAIIEYRTAHGPFVRIEDIELVTGIGPKTFADIKPFITIDPPKVEPVVIPAKIEEAPKPVPRAAAPMVVPAKKTITVPPEAPAQKTNTLQSAAATASEPTSHTALWFSLAALAGLLGGGVAGVRYLRPQGVPAETMPTAEEFYIEE